MIILPYLVVIDNAPIHRSKKFMAKVEQWRELDLWIYFLPPYSPELNIIEILWRFMKYQWLPFDAYLNFMRLKARVAEVLECVGLKYRINFC
ncbi:MAG: transposase [Rikenellaceae bacterium]